MKNLVKMTLGMMVLASALTVNASGISYAEVKENFNKGQKVQMSDIATVSEAQNGAPVYRMEERIGKKSSEIPSHAGAGLLKVKRNYKDADTNEVVFTKEEVWFCNLSDLSNCQPPAGYTLTHGKSDNNVASFKYEQINGSLAAITEKGDKKIIVEYRKTQDQLIARVKIQKKSGALLQDPTFTIHRK